MRIYVIDTNVAVVANGGNPDAEESCQAACKRKLMSVWNGEMIAIDDGGEIIAEYRKHLSHSGKPGMGDKFFKYLFDYQHLKSRVQRVRITPCNDEERGFAELPPNELDRQDRKFLAVALVAAQDGGVSDVGDVVIVNATDSDWREQRALIDGLGVMVEQLCPQHKRAKQGKRKQPMVEGH